MSKQSGFLSQQVTNKQKSASKEQNQFKRLLLENKEKVGCLSIVKYLRKIGKLEEIKYYCSVRLVCNVFRLYLFLTFTVLVKLDRSI